MHDIFLSYSSKDRELVKPLYDALKQQGWTVFWDHATIQTGEQWSHIIEANLNASDCVIVVWTANSVQSEYVLDEATRARNRNILIPVSLGQIPPPIGFGMRQTTDLSDWDGKADHPKFAEISRPLLDRMRQATQKRLAEFKQRETELIQTQSQLAQQRDELAKQSQAAQQLQSELTRQAAELEEQRAELAQQVAQGAADFAPQLAAAEQRSKELNDQLKTAREQARLAEQKADESAKRLADEIAANQSAQAQLAQQLTDSQAQQEQLSLQIKVLDDKQQELLRQATSDKEELTRQQTELKQQQQRVEKAEQAQRTAQEKQQAAEQARQVADKDRQTAEDKLRTVEQNQQAERTRLKQQLAEQEGELTTLRQRPTVEVEKVVEKVVFKETRSPKDKLIGAVAGGLLVAAAWGVIGNLAEPVDTNQNQVAPTISMVEAAKPVAVLTKPTEDKVQQHLAAIAAANKTLEGDNEDARKAAIQQLLKLSPLDGEAMRRLGLAYEIGEGVAMNFQKACSWYQQAVQAGDSKANNFLSDLRKSKKCE